MLFYSTIYVGDLYKRSLPAAATTDQQQATIDEEATRLGSRALFYAALLSLISSLILPIFVTEDPGHPSQKKRSSWWNRISSCHPPRGMQVQLITMWATSQLVFAGCMFATLCVTTFLCILCINYISIKFTIRCLPFLQFHSQRMGVHFHHHCYGIFICYRFMGSILLG